MKGSDVFLVYYKRSAFSRSRPNDPSRDWFNEIRMDEVVARLIRGAVEQLGLNPREIGDVVLGCSYQRDENWTYGGRHPVFLAELPFDVTSMAVDRACSSSMNALTIGAMEIATGNAEVVIAGGFEHMTHVPRLSNRLNEKLLRDEKYGKYRMDVSYSMGLTAENLAELRGITRPEMDEFSLRSHRLAARAQDEGYFKEEILPIEVTQNGERLLVDRDQSVRRDTTLEALSKLPPAFKSGGLITAGNSSPLNAGATLAVLASGKSIQEHGWEPLSRVVSFGWAGVPPYIMGEGAVPAALRALERASLKAEEIDLWEINEAFAVVTLNAIRELGIDASRVNTRGGAIAIGHPLGATGVRLVGTLSRALRADGRERGVATLCVGGGQGYAVVVERA